MKRIVAIILGIEIGLLIWFILAQTFVIYIVVGIVHYLLPFISETILSWLTILLCCSCFCTLTLVTANKYFRQFIAAIFCLPAVTFIVYFLFFLPPNKAKAVNTELTKHNKNKYSDNLSYIQFQNKINTMLVNFTTHNSESRNNLHLAIFGIEEKKAEQIKIDTLFIAPDEKIGVCLFTFLDSIYTARAIYFSIKKNSVDKLFSGGLLAHGYGVTREEALTEMKYDMFITSKKRVEVVNLENYSVKKVEYPSILESKYWQQTIKLDTVYMTINGAIEN